MKKILILSMTVLMILCNTWTVSANDTIITTYIEETYEDGSYLEVVLEEEISYARNSTKTGKKTYNYKDASDTILWSLSVSGAFTYDGTTATCTVSNASTTCPSSDWTLSNKSATKSGSTATASITAKQTSLLGITLQTINKTIKLTCSPDGVLS